MQTVEQNVNSMADDGRMVSLEHDSTGETGSVAESREDARREWQEIIDSPKYHDLYTEHVSEIVRKRLKGEGESKQMLKDVAGMLGLDDPAAIVARLSELLTPAVRDWQSEEAAVKEKYPEFLLEREVRDPNFAALLESFASSPAVTLTKLYELFHLDSLAGSVARAVAEQTATDLLGAVQVRHARPHENGLAGTPGRTGVNTSRLTRAERAILAQRAAKGEKITF